MDYQEFLFADIVDSACNLSAEDTALFLLKLVARLQGYHDAGMAHGQISEYSIIISAHGGVRLLKPAHAIKLSISRTGRPTFPVAEQPRPLIAKLTKQEIQFDLNALGAVAYMLIIGKSPFKLSNADYFFENNLPLAPPPPHRLRPDCPSALSRIVRKAMCPDQQRCYSSAKQMRVDLERLRDSLLYDFQTLENSTELSG